MRVMETEEEAEDTAFLAEHERRYRFAKCLFEDCLCDGASGKLICFHGMVDGHTVWKCPRFQVDKLNADSAMRQAYLSLVAGVAP
jgi:hypothetical protein